MIFKDEQTQIVTALPFTKSLIYKGYKTDTESLKMKDQGDL